MKRRREKETEIELAIEEVSLLLHHHHLPSGAPAPPPPPGDELSHVPTKPLLALSNLVLKFLDKIGPSMNVLRQDMSRNVQRLEARLELDPKKYSNVVEILKREADEGSAKKRDSCSRALLWLTRSLDLMVELLERIGRDSTQSMEQLVEDSYNLTLKPWHGWISFAAYKVSLRLLPDRRSFTDLLVAKGGDTSTLSEQIGTLIVLVAPLLHDLHFAMRIYGVNELKCT